MRSATYSQPLEQQVLSATQKRQRGRRLAAHFLPYLRDLPDAAFLPA